MRATQVSLKLNYRIGNVKEIYTAVLAVQLKHKEKLDTVLKDFHKTNYLCVLTNWEWEVCWREAPEKIWGGCQPLGKAHVWVCILHSYSSDDIDLSIIPKFDIHMTIKLQDE